MRSFGDFATRASGFLNRWLLCLLLGVYVLAAFLPDGGLWAREVGFGEVQFLGERARVTLLMALLALMLFSAGLNIPLAQVRRLVREPAVLATGFLANLAVPVLYIFAVSLVLRARGDIAAGQGVLLGLALVASMPIATSSAAWSQTSNGNLALDAWADPGLDPAQSPHHSVDAPRRELAYGRRAYGRPERPCRLRSEPAACRFRAVAVAARRRRSRAAWRSAD